MEQVIAKNGRATDKVVKKLVEVTEQQMSVTKSV
jgi:hypothetical protein